MKLPLNQIIIGERQRIDLGDLEDLASIEDPDVGLIVPIIVHKTLNGFELVDGRRRLQKVTNLGWKEVECYERDQLTNVQKQKAELFADIGRKDRTWQETALSVNKIHKLLVREKKDDGERWTLRMTARFTGFSLGNISYFIRVAEGLEKTPRDEPLWSAPDFTSAIKVLLQREVDATRAEQELRRQAIGQQDNLPSITEELGPVIGDQEWNEAAHGELGSVPEQDLNRAEPVVWLRGYNEAFNPERIKARLFCVISFGNDFNPALSILDNRGYLISWQAAGYTVAEVGEFQPWNLVWNQIRTPESSSWPFAMNYMVGIVLRPKGATAALFGQPRGSVISATPNDDGSLPPAVIDFSIDAVCPPHYPVLILGNINPVHVAETGHPPIFFEPDPVIFETKMAALREHYEQIVPGVRFKTEGGAQ